MYTVSRTPFLWPAFVSHVTIRHNPVRPALRDNNRGGEIPTPRKYRTRILHQNVCFPVRKEKKTRGGSKVGHVHATSQFGSYEKVTLAIFSMVSFRDGIYLLNLADHLVSPAPNLDGMDTTYITPLTDGAVVYCSVG